MTRDYVFFKVANAVANYGDSHNHSRKEEQPLGGTDIYIYIYITLHVQRQTIIILYVHVWLYVHVHISLYIIYIYIYTLICMHSMIINAYYGEV